MNTVLCPHCGADVSDHTSVQPVLRVPHDGDYSFCIYCAKWSVFESAQLRVPNDPEMADILSNPDCRRVHFAYLLMQMSNPLKGKR